ncbi:MAG TPA: protein kinase, partial [Ktedonobacteraceae bacterium]
MMEHGEQRLGNYRLIQLLGKGAFADVYLGEHFYLNTPVAIKVLRSRLDSSTLADFLTEARHISHLVHPHIIRVFDFGLEEEAPFLVMDYAPYGNLRRLYPPGTVVPLSTIVPVVRVGLVVEGRHLPVAGRPVQRDRLGQRPVGLQPQHPDPLCRGSGLELGQQPAAEAEAADRGRDPHP